MAYLNSEAGLEPGELGPDTKIFEEGYFDSLFALTLVAYCEEEFGCTIETEEMSEDNFGSPAAIVSLLERKQ